MISLDNIRIAYNGIPLFDGISFFIQEKEKIGLIGNNGAGKTSLLKVIRGDLIPDQGNIQIPDDIKIGYLPQHIKFTDESKIFFAVYNSLETLVSIKNKINTITEQITERTDYNSEEYLSLLDKLHDLNQQYNVLGGDTIEAEIKRTLKGLGFTDEDMYRPLTEFSGGWRMRVELAKILLRKPDLLLLDEPTNHLDIESIQWFESYLQTFQGAVILISHDRAFLDNVTNRTLELNLGKLYDYKVPYSQFVEEKQKRLELQQAAQKNQQKKIKETERFIERFRYKASKASLVQSRIKQLEKMEEVQVEEQDMSSINIRFAEAPRSGREVIKCNYVTKDYDELRVLHGINLTVERQERIAFVGKNGEGKTTLAKIITGDLSYSGEVSLGYNVKLGYYAQNQDELLNGDKTVLQTMEDYAEGEIRKHVRTLLGAFLFQGEDVDKKVQVLSGGERSRLALATLLLKPYNLLVLDEPTNHLDMRSKEVLKQALQEYNGALVIVSHDRDFLDGLVDKVYEFKNKNLKEHIGGIYDFLKKKDINALDDLNNVSVTPQKTPGTKNKESKEAFEQRKEHNKKIRKVEKDIDQVEKNIENMEEKFETLKEQMSKPDKQDNQELYEKYGSLKKKYDEELNRWETLHEQLEELQNQHK